MVNCCRVDNSFNTDVYQSLFSSAKFNAESFFTAFVSCRVEPDLEEEVLGAAAISGTVPAKPEDGREGQHLPPLPRLELWHFFFSLSSAPQDMPIKQFKKSKVMKKTSKFKTQAIAPTVTFCVYFSIYIITEISEKKSFISKLM